MNSVKIFEAGFGHKAAGSKPFRIFRRTLASRQWTMRRGQAGMHPMRTPYDELALLVFIELPPMRLISK
jgi:hypothetical protein